MRTVIAICATLALTLSSAAAIAGPGEHCHFHGSKAAAESTIVGCADARRNALVKGGKLDTTWSAAKHEKIEQIDGKKGKEWKISYKNPSAPDKDKQALFMFFTAPGNFIAANHTGQ